MSEGSRYDNPISHFYIVPNMSEYTLNVYEHRLYCHILFRGGEKGNFWEAIETTAIYCDMSISKVREARKSLVEKGFIEVKTREGETSLIEVLYIWNRNKELAQNLPTLEEVYEAQTGKPYSERGQGHDERGRKGGLQKSENTRNKNATPSNSASPTPSNSASPTPSNSASQTILTEQNPMNNNSMPETSSGGDSQAPNNFSIATDSPLGNATPKQRGASNSKAKSEPDYKLNPHLYSDKPMPTMEFLKLPVKQQNVVILAMICWYLSNNKPATEEDVYKRIGVSWEAKVLKAIRMVNGLNPETLVKWAKEYRANQYGSATLSPDVLAQRYAQWLAGHTSRTSAPERITTTNQNSEPEWIRSGLEL